MHDIVSRPYTSDDLSGCMAIFDSNVPTFFAPEERKDFCECLESINDRDRPYLVMLRKDSVVACGGLITEAEKRQARLAWVMVDRALHGQRLGTSLTHALLARARATPNISEVGLETSQHTHGFYEGFGFTVAKVTRDGLAPGLDCWDMTLRLT